MTESFMPYRCPQCGAPLPPGIGDQTICQFCGSSLIRLKAARAGPGQAAAPQEAPSQPWGIRLKTVSCIDQQGIGVEAFRMLIPADWRFEGGVHWLMNNPGMPAVIACRAYNPQGVEAFEIFPNISCYWTNNPMVTMMFPMGSLYFGNEVRPPMPALQALQQLVVPRYRGKMPGLQIVQQEHLPDLPKALRANAPPTPGPIPQADGARLRLRYRQDGQEVDEDLFGVVELTRVAMPMLFGAQEHIYWMANYLFSFRAKADSLDRLADQFQAIVRSFRLNPQWYGRYLQVSQFLIQNQIQQIQHIGQLSRIISQTSDQISDMIMDSYYQRQATMDRLAEQFSQAIRGVNEYYNPFEDRPVELPGGYNYAWANALGEYILTDDPNFNPNLGSNLTWQQMEQKR